MSYAAAAALQAAVFARLSGWAALTGVSVVDALPPRAGTNFPSYFFGTGNRQ